MVLDDRFHRTNFWDVVAQRGATWVNAVPSIITILAQEPPGPTAPSAPSSVRFVRSASAPLSEAVLARFEQRYGVPVMESYGMTEAGSQITANPLADRRPGTVGIPVDVELRVVGDGEAPLPPGDVGRVEIRGAGVIRHYENGVGAERFRAGGWLDTGDLGAVDHDGFLTLAGREGDVINRGGEKIFPREVEDVLLAHRAVADAVVVGRDDEVLGQVPVAYVVPAPDAPDDLEEQLTARCPGGSSPRPPPRRLRRPGRRARGSDRQARSPPRRRPRPRVADRRRGAPMSANAAASEPDTLGPPHPVAESRGRRHLYEVDIVRLLTFVCVVGVHAVSGSMDPDNVASGAFVSLLHFTRGTFFLLSTFVLTYALGSKPVEVRRFWPRRFLYVGVPYVVWTVIYWWIALGRLPGVDDLGQLGHELLTGTGNYHLYFLLVSLQLYLLFPLLVWLVRRTRGHHQALFLVSGALELVLLALTHYATWPGSWATVQANALVLAPTYQFYFVAGALAAVHHDRFHAWVVGRPRAVVGALVVTAALHVGVYLVQLPSSGSVARAYDPLQPSVVPWTVAVTLGLYAVGIVYARSRRPGTRLRHVRRARRPSPRSACSSSTPSSSTPCCGPLAQLGYSSLDPTLSGALAWAGTLVLSYAFAALVIRTPLALPLAGRKRLQPRPTRSVTHA